MKQNGPTTKEQKQKQLEMFLLDVALDGVLSEVSDQVPTRRHSGRTIKDAYGNDCLSLFKLCFSQWQRGGRTLEGKPYKTLWRFNTEVAGHLFELNQQRRKGTMLTAKEWVKYLEEKGFEPAVRVKLYNDDLTSFETELLGPKDLAEWRALQRDIRKSCSDTRKLRESLS